MPGAAELSEPMTVAEVVASGTFASTRDDKAVRQAMERVGVWPLRDAMFAHLAASSRASPSLGRLFSSMPVRKRERAQAVPHRRRAGLRSDPKRIGLVMRCLAEEAQRGRGVVVVLHDLTLAARHADHAVALAESGRLAASGRASRCSAPRCSKPSSA